MNTSEPRPGAVQRLLNAPGRILRAVRAVVLALVLAWATLAIFYSPIPWTGLRIGLAAGFAAFGIWALWLTRRPRVRWAFAALYLVVVVAWSFVRPSHDREWRPEVAVMPRAFVEGDRVRITGVRDFDYRSRDDFTVRHKERVVYLSDLVGLDFYISFWKPGPIGHTFLSFMFENAPPISVSIETRPEAHEGYDPLASMFRKYELIYVVGEERDLVGVRTNFRGEDVLVYRLRVPAAGARRLFEVYIERINQLADQAEFYHLLSNSCTVNIVRHANIAGRVGALDIRHILNGWIDRYFYNARLLVSELPFAELRRRSHVDPAVSAAEEPAEFARDIRATIPGMRPPPSSFSPSPSSPSRNDTPAAE
jgi:hypothetical protein